MFVVYHLRFGTVSIQCDIGCLLEEKIILFRASKIFQVAKSQISIRPFQCLLFQNEDVK